MTAQALEQFIVDAENAFERQEWLEGENYLRLALQEEPTHGKAHNHMGWLHLNHLESYDLAEMHLKLAMKYTRNYSAPYVHMAQLLFDSNRFEEHGEILRKAQKLPGINFAMIHNDLGRAEEVHGRIRKAIQAYKTALRWCLNDHELEVIKANIRRCKTKRWLLIW